MDYIEYEDMKFCTTLGYEFTFLPGKSSRESTRADALSNLVRADMFDMELQGTADTDEKAVEIDSPPFKTLWSLQEYWEKIESIVSQYDLVATHPDKYSGGGHIHAGNPRGIKKELFWLNCIREVQNRPYLNWMFNEYDDDCSSEPVIFEPTGWRILTRNHHVFESRGFYESHFDVAKGYATRVDFGHTLKRSTIEFRFFNAVEDWSQLFDHTMFLDAFLRRIIKKCREGKKVRTRIKTADAIKDLIKKDKAIVEFRKLLKSLGLDVSRYDYYIETNYMRRKEIGLLKKEVRKYRGEKR